MKNRWAILHILIVLAIAVITCGPIGLAMGAGTFAEAMGCTLHEGFVNPCVVGGVDLGSTLYAFGMMGWLGIVTLPLGLLLLAVYLVIVFVVWIVRRVQASQETPKVD
ncbi:MAG: hypothetical protein KIS85_00805 [Anaerolineales bacterium]|nr:hypothetical protein [Anaerolineales bacterium]